MNTFCALSFGSVTGALVLTEVVIGPVLPRRVCRS